MLFPAARHAEFRPVKPVTAKGSQHGFGVAADMRLHLHAAPLQRSQQRFGKRRAKQNIHAQFRHAPRQFLRRERTEDKFLARDFLPALPRDQQQPRRRIQQRRDAFLRSGYGNRHN